MFALEYTFEGKMFAVIFFCGNLFLQIARKIVKIAKIRTRKNFVPHGISSLSKLCLFCSQPVPIFEENNKKIVPFVGEKLQRIRNFLY